MNRGAGSIQVGPVRFQLEQVLSSSEAAAIAAAITEQRSSLDAPPFSGGRRLEDDAVPYSDHLRGRIATLTDTGPAQQEAWAPQRIDAGPLQARRQWLRRADPEWRAGGQRIYCAVLYLEGSAGEGLAFHGLGVRVAAAPGTVVVWNLLDVTGRGIHESAPMAVARRRPGWELVTWVREGHTRNPFDAPTRQLPRP